MDRLLHRRHGNFVREGSRSSPKRGGTRRQGSIEGAAQPGREATQGSGVVPEVARDSCERCCRTIRLSSPGLQPYCASVGLKAAFWRRATQPKSRAVTSCATATRPSSTNLNCRRYRKRELRKIRPFARQKRLKSERSH